MIVFRLAIDVRRILAESVVGQPALLARLRSGCDPAGVPGVCATGMVPDCPPSFIEDLDAWPVWDDSLTSIADPESADTVYLPNVYMHKSTDGGKSFSNLSAIASNAFLKRSSEVLLM